MAELSPAARAVLSAAEDAYGYNYSEFYCCADRVATAALRAAADQCAEGATHWKLHAIAAELEGHV